MNASECILAPVHLFKLRRFELRRDTLRPGARSQSLVGGRPNRPLIVNRRLPVPPGYVYVGENLVAAGYCERRQLWCAERSGYGSAPRSESPGSKALPSLRTSSIGKIRYWKNPLLRKILYESTR